MKNKLIVMVCVMSMLIVGIPVTAKEAVFDVETTYKSFASPTLKVTVKSKKYLKFAFTKLPSNNVRYNGKKYTNFCYYKIVASKIHKNPEYPRDGYLHYTTKRSENRWSLNPAKDDYNHSPILKPEKKYYFAITYVFGNGTFTTNAVRVTIPKSSNVAVKFVPKLSVAAVNNSLAFQWKSLPGDSVKVNGKVYSGFKYYKVVASESNARPKYPKDGYVFYTDTIELGKWSFVPDVTEYNPSPELIAGESYYFAITYVFESGSFSSNVKRILVPSSVVSTPAA